MKCAIKPRKAEKERKATIATKSKGKKQKTVTNMVNIILMISRNILNISGLNEPIKREIVKMGQKHETLLAWWTAGTIREVKQGKRWQDWQVQSPAPSASQG